jgi:hypothetical protein
MPSGTPVPTSSRNADLQRVIEHVRQLEAHAAAMAKTAALGAAADEQAARKDFEGMVVIAVADLKWLPSADVPDTLRGRYKTLLSNIDLNASRLVDGSADRYFIFLGTKLAPLWLADIDKLRAIPLGSGSS